MMMRAYGRDVWRESRELFGPVAKWWPLLVGGRGAWTRGALRTRLTSTRGEDEKAVDVSSRNSLVPSLL